jgi:pyruvate dehydrogenase E2 component (dihydrolipoamide acetyltransferase)
VARVAVEIPKIGLVMERVRITRWLKGVGEAVKSGEPLFEVETEKSVVEIEAAVSGRLEQILVPADQEATVGERIAWVETGEPSSMSSPRPEPLQPGGRIRSSPLARRMAGDLGLDLRAITGSGPGGRVQLADVMRDVPARAGFRLSPMQQALARAMNLSNATVPQFTVERGVDCTAMQALRADFGATSPPDSHTLSLNDFLLQAVARTLVEIPGMNATFSGSGDLSDARIVPASGAHVGLVVAVDGGLLVPVFHGAERYGLMELALKRHDCVDRARRGRLEREELEGATFSITNLGNRGPDRFAAMINPPESAILAVGRQRDCVVAKHGAVAVRASIELTLTVDHRVASGRLAAEFLTRLAEILEGNDWRP